ncbi:MAG: hypothetical protein WC718_18400, partial [Phycisphaerales bacterium]
MSTRTMLQLVQSIAENLGALEQGTATGGSTTTVVCTDYPFKLTRANASNKTYEGAEIRVTDATNTAVVGTFEVSGYVANTGTFTLGSTAAFIIAATDTFDIYKRGIRYADVYKAVNRALRRHYYRTLSPVSLLADADM